MQSRSVREWTLHEALGQGGMGVVYRATHELLRGDFAVKVLRPELVGDGEARRRFVQEAAHAATLRHPNVVCCEVPFVEAGTVYLPMERLRGRTLAEQLTARPGPWPWADAVPLARQAALGLGYAHRAGLVHRDVKPANLWVTEDEPPVVKVLDFGLAKVVGEQSLTAAGQFVGTPAYVAPEVLHGERPTAAADVYALGVVLFRMLTGRLPVEVPEHVSSPAAIVLQIVKAQERGLPRVSATGGAVPPWLDDLVAWMLSASPTDRPADGDVVAAALVAAPAAAPVEAEGVSRFALPTFEAPATAPAPASAPRPSPQWIWPAAAALAVAGGLGAWLLTRPPADDQAPATAPPAADATVQAPPAIDAAAVVPPADAAVDAAPPAPHPAGTVWKRIPGGCFQMGSKASKREQPVHEVCVPDFELAETEVTNAQYAACVRAGACTAIDFAACTDRIGMPDADAAFQGDDQPVVCVTWHEARAYATWVGGRLPSEAEWEYAARSGGRDQLYPWGDDKATCARAIITERRKEGCGRDAPWPVKSRPGGASIHGVHDLIGNVWEWTEDTGAPNHEGAPTDGSARTDDSPERVLKGGSWFWEPIRATARGMGAPGDRERTNGFRPARSPERY